MYLQLFTSFHRSSPPVVGDHPCLQPAQPFIVLPKDSIEGVAQGRGYCCSCKDCTGDSNELEKPGLNTQVEVQGRQERVHKDMGHGSRLEGLTEEGMGRSNIVLPPPKFNHQLLPSHPLSSSAS